ncbi:MAG TPA: response regulator transcription factor [Candidatus Dormibacteraeota bacterium]|jgi:DNA-binding response OmpR family regulator|nr:response regulator transcription factor [Candidatus Dormibacteraeota bacterium]
MRVLLIEDDRRLAASVQRGLGESGLAVDTFPDGEDGLAAVLSTPYDVIVMDVMLPGGDGFAVSRKLRQQKISTPILMLTARDAVDDRVRGLEAGADDYMVKPFAMRELLARIRALARRHLPDRSAVLISGAIALDTSAHRVTVNGDEVELTAKEFAILDFFMHHPGRLLSRSQIIEHVWDYDFDGGQNLIEVYMGRLRRKLTAAGAGDPFVTIRGSGYRLEPRQ